MRLLEEFWYGNIEPTEYDTSASKEYKEVLQLITRNEEKLLANHVPGVLRKTLEVHISMTVIILRSCLCPHFFHQLPYGLSLRHHACSFLPAVPGNKKATIYQPPYRS